MKRLPVAAATMAAAILLGLAGAGVCLASSAATPTVSSVVSCLKAGGAFNITTPSSPPAYGAVTGAASKGLAFGIFLFDNTAQANGFISKNEPENGASAFTANGGLTFIYIGKGTATAVGAAKTLIAGCVTGGSSASSSGSSTSSTATPSVASVVSCLKAGGGTDVSAGNHKPPAYGTVEGTGPANPKGALRFFIVLFNNVAAANVYVAAYPPNSTELLDKANGGQTLIYIFKAEGEGNWGVAPTEALLSKCFSGQAKTAPSASPPSTAATPTVSSVVSCLKAGGASDVTTPSSPPAYGVVLATASSGTEFGLYLFSTTAQASSWVSDHTVPHGDSLYKVNNAGTVLVVVPSGSGSSQAESLVAKCTGPAASSVPSTAPSNPNTASAVAACLTAAKASKVTTPSNPPAYGTVAAYAPSGPSVVVFLFHTVSQANGFLKANPVSNGASVFTADAGVTLVYINKGTAAAVSAAKTLIAGCIK